WVRRSWDPLTGRLLCEVEWCLEDALPFPLCLSSRADPPDCRSLNDVSVALGNVILADAGETCDEEIEPAVRSRLIVQRCPDDCTGAERFELAERYRPRLVRPNLSFAAPYDAALPAAGSCRAAAAAAALRQEPHRCGPQLLLVSADPVSGTSRTWRPRTDLLASGPDDLDFVVEVDDRRVAWLRFGDGVEGRAPEAGEHFRATYRIGGGPSGNVGPDSLTRIVFRKAFPDGVMLNVRNPMAAASGASPEPTARARLRAPHLFGTRLRRAVAPDDYAAIAVRDFPAAVQRAGAVLRATGAAAEVQVAIDSFGSADPEPELLRLIENHLQGFRCIFHDV